ncbi:MAG: hypothetical protein QM698_11470 [Micropepsaceae bacterium]
MSADGFDHKATADELYRNPRLGRGFMRGQLLGMMEAWFAVFWRLAHPVMEGGAPLPPVNALKVLAWQLQQATAVPGAQTVITMEKTMGRSAMTMAALPAWLGYRQWEPREIHVAARTGAIAAEARRRHRRLALLPHHAWLKETLRFEVLEDGSERERVRPTPGQVTWGVAADSKGRDRFLDDLIVCDPLGSASDATEAGLEALAQWLEQKQSWSRRPDRIPSITVLSEAHSGLPAVLAARGWTHIDIPSVAPDDIALPFAQDRELEWGKGKRIVLQPYTPYELGEIRRSMSAAAFEVAYS